MKRAAAYGMVVQELERWRCLASDALIRQVGSFGPIRSDGAVAEVEQEEVKAYTLS